MRLLWNILPALCGGASGSGMGGTFDLSVPWQTHDISLGCNGCSPRWRDGPGVS